MRLRVLRACASAYYCVRVVVVVLCFSLIDLESVGQKIKQHTIKGKKNELGI